MHPVTAWYLVQARHDDMMRELARPRLPRLERPERHNLLERVAATLHRSKPAPTTRAIAGQAPAGCGLPIGCAV